MGICMFIQRKFFLWINGKDLFSMGIVCLFKSELSKSKIILIPLGRKTSLISYCVLAATVTIGLLCFCLLVVA